MALAKKPFVVLDAEILSSSVWSEAPHIKLVWITLLVLCDTEGYVGASVPGIARAAGVPLKQAEEAIQRFQEPDEYSRTKTEEGRRLEVAERGFRILNFLEHVDRLSSEKAKSRDRVRRWRERRASKGPVTVTPDNVTVPLERREQGEENSEQRERTEERSDLPHDQRAEKAISANRVRLERELLSLSSKIAELEDEDPPKIIRQLTSYKRADGGNVGGRVNPALLSFERLEKSVEDGRGWLSELEAEKK